MDLISFQYDRSFVLEALRQGDIDYLEHVSEAAEADLFRHLIRRQIIRRLADTYPTPRKKEEVPVWMYLSSELTLKLHGAQSYHAFPRILRCGGLIEALGPELGGRKTSHPETGDVTLACPGFNDKNDYDRQTPCDQALGCWWYFYPVRVKTSVTLPPDLLASIDRVDTNRSAFVERAARAYLGRLERASREARDNRNHQPQRGPIEPRGLGRA